MCRFFYLVRLGAGVVASSLVAYSAVVALVPADLCAQSPQPAAKTRDGFAGSKAGEEWDGNGLKMKFCWCPPGKFTMGSPKDETGRHDNEDQVSVTISRGYWLGKYEVTQGEWERIIGTTLREQRDKADPKEKLDGEGATYPMHYVSHLEATDFCQHLTIQER